MPRVDCACLTSHHRCYSLLVTIFSSPTYYCALFFILSPYDQGVKIDDIGLLAGISNYYYDSLWSANNFVGEKEVSCLASTRSYTTNNLLITSCTISYILFISLHIETTSFHPQGIIVHPPPPPPPSPPSLHYQGLCCNAHLKLMSSYIIKHHNYYSHTGCRWIYCHPCGLTSKSSSYLVYSFGFS